MLVVVLSLQYFYQKSVRLANLKRSKRRSFGSNVARERVGSATLIANNYDQVQLSGSRMLSQRSRRIAQNTNSTKGCERFAFNTFRRETNPTVHQVSLTEVQDASLFQM